jgi:DNA-binding IclR family transcriptional regulator
MEGKSAPIPGSSSRKRGPKIEGPDRASVRAADRALRLLACFSEGRTTITLSEFSRITGLPVSTVSRLLATLENSGFVRRGAGGAYACGTRLLQIGLTALQSVTINEIAEPYLRQLTKTTGESAYLGIPADDGSIIYVRQSVSPKAIRHSAWLGRSVPRAGTAIGAAMDGRVATTGYSMTRRTIEPDVTAIAAPVRSPHGSIIAAINVVGPSFRISDRDIPRFGKAVVQAAAEISRELGARNTN